MANTVVAYNLFTNGNELKKLDGERYVGSYYIMEDGTIMSGRSPEQQNPPSEVLLPADYMPINSNNELVSIVNTETNTFDGIYSVITVKNYKNDIEFPEAPPEEKAPPSIILQPDQFFRRDSAISYDPGMEIFVDQNRTIQVATGSIIPLSINFVSDDDPANITFEWIDSYERVVATTQDFIIDTATVDWTEETFYCVLTDSFGSETSNDVSINIIDPFNHPIIFNNILQNGYGNEDTAEWQSIGQAPEEIGKFLPTFETSLNPDGLVSLSTGNTFDLTGLGTIHYHKFSIVTGSGYGSVYKNQWYPRPEAIDFYNGLNISKDIQDNYFRAGQFYPVSPEQNDHSGTSKSSFQDVDLTEYEAILSGKVYGIRGFRAVLFGWLGARADQGDRCYVEFKFYDENDLEIPIDTDANNNKIESLTVWDRIINEARLDGNGNPPPTGVYQVGYYDPDFDFDYTGSFYDGNDAIELSAVQGRTRIVGDNGLVQELVENALCKTQIVGKMSDMIGMPNRVRKIKVIKYYFHEAGKYDLVNRAKDFQELNVDYISDAMIAGLNLRLYPILVDSSGDVLDTGINESTGLPVIEGFNMDQLEVTPTITFIDDLEMQLDSIEWLNSDTALSGNQLFTGRSNIEGRNSTAIPIITTDGYPNKLNMQPLGNEYTVTANAIMFDMYKKVLTPFANTLHDAIYQYTQVDIPFRVGGVTFTYYQLDEFGLLNYGTPGQDDTLWPDFDDDNIFQ